MRQRRFSPYFTVPPLRLEMSKVFFARQRHEPTCHVLDTYDDLRSLPLVTCHFHLPLATYHLPLPPCHLPLGWHPRSFPLVTCHLAPATCRLPHVTCHLPLATCHSTWSLAICDLSLATCHLPLATSHLQLATTSHFPLATCLTSTSMPARQLLLADVELSPSLPPLPDDEELPGKLSPGAPAISPATSAASFLPSLSALRLHFCFRSSAM